MKTGILSSKEMSQKVGRRRSHPYFLNELLPGFYMCFDVSFGDRNEAVKGSSC